MSQALPPCLKETVSDFQMRPAPQATTEFIPDPWFENSVLLLRFGSSSLSTLYGSRSSSLNFLLLETIVSKPTDGNLKLVHHIWVKFSVIIHQEESIMETGKDMETSKQYKQPRQAGYFYPVASLPSRLVQDLTHNWTERWQDFQGKRLARAYWMLM